MDTKHRTIPIAKTANQAKVTKGDVPKKDIPPAKLEPAAKKMAPKKAAPAAAAAAPPPPPPNSTLAWFGKTTEHFSMEDATNIYQTEGENALVTYLRKYFAKTSTPIGFAMFEPDSPPHLLKITELAHFVGGKAAKLGRFGADNKPQSIKPYSIVDAFEFVKCAVDPSKPPVYEEKKKTYINLFGGWLHSHDQPKPTAAEMKMIEPFINHIRTIWCPNDPVMFEFVMRWFARIAQMGKNQIGLYLKAAQGIGKSIIFEFMRQLVFGSNTSLATDRPSIIVGDFNAGLQGRVLLILEEMPTSTSGQYQELTNRLKQLCTGSTIQTTKKHAEEITVKNTLSVAVLTNREALAFQEGDRRWAQLDMSESKKGDKKYFDTIAFENFPKEKQKAVGVAMWRHLLSINLTGKFDNIAPPTRSKAMQMIPAAATWIKEKFLNPDTGCSIPRQRFSTFYDTFKQWYEDKRFKVTTPDKKKFAQQLNMIKCITKKEMRFGGNPVTGIADVPLAALIKEFDEKMWIDREIDDIIDPAIGPPAPTDVLLDDRLTD